MDNNVIVAIIGGVASIVSAAITALLTAERTESGRSAMRVLRSRTFLVTTGIVAITATFLAGYLFDVFGFRAASAFQQNQLLEHAKFDGIASNASVALELDLKSPQLPATLPSYLAPEAAVNAKLASSALGMKQTLVYDSSLSSDQGFTICRFIRLRPVNKDASSGVRLVMWAQDDDRVELGLKDRLNREARVPLTIHRGWAVYEIPFPLFDPVSPTSLTEFHIAFTGYLHERDSNVVKIGLLSTY